jgi:predicted nuclease of predicted toxin-antitoxin system
LTLHVKLDEQLSHQLVEIFNRTDYEVSTVLDQELSGCADSKLWPVVQEQEALLITADKEFADIRKYPPGSHNGVVLLRPKYESLPAFQFLIEEIVLEHDLAKLVGITAVVNEKELRIRSE